MFSSDLVGDFAFEGKTASFVESPPNPQEIAEKINYLFENPGIGYNYAYNGYKKVRSFSWDDNTSKLMELIDESINTSVRNDS